MSKTKGNKMNTTQHLLPAINGLYELNLTDKNIEDINSKVSNLQNKTIEMFKGDGDESKVSTVLNALKYQVKGSSVIVSSGYGSSVDIQKTTHNYFVEDGQYRHWGDKTEFFKFSPSYGTDIYFENIKDSDFEALYVISHILTNTSFPDILNKVFKNVSDFRVEYERNLKTAWDSTHIPVEKEDIDKLLGSFFKGGKLTTTAPSEKTTRLLNSNPNLYFIAHVLELDNFRGYVSYYSSTYGYGTRYNSFFRLVPHSDPSYDYVDVGRVYYLGSGTHLHYSGRNEKRMVPLGNLIFTDPEPTLPNRVVLSNYLLGKNGDYVEFLDNNSLNILTKRELQRSARKEAKSKAKNKLREKIEKRLQTLLTPGKSLKLNGVTYSDEKIEYEGQVLRSDIPNLTYKILNTLSRAYSLDDVNFDQALPIFLSYVSDSEGIGNVGEVSFKVEKRVSTNTLGFTATRIYVNNKRINSDEVESVLERGLCFTNQADFDYFIASVSKCSLKIHTYLQVGVDINVRDEFDNITVALKLPLERRKNINYLVINDESYRVKNTQKVIGLSRKGSMMDVVNTLLDGKSVEGVEVDSIKGIISSGKKAYVDAIEKSKELLTDTEKTFNIEEETVTMGDGSSKTGYLIKGSLRKYFIDTGGKEQIDTNDPQCGVYSFPEGRYICIVDKSSSQVGMDKLVNRIYALHNDALVASAINTL